MDALDFGEQRTLLTEDGPIELDVACHADGSLSIVAWSPLVRRCIGRLRCGQRRFVPVEVSFETYLAGPALRTTMWSLLAKLQSTVAGRRPIGQRLVATGELRQADVDDLLGWQWLLADLGEARRLGDLAVDAGLLTARLGSEEPGSRA